MRALSSVNRTGIAATLTRPVYLVEFGFATPLRLSSRNTISYAGNSFTEATVTVDLAGLTVRILNASLAYTATFKDGGDGVAVTIWVLYGDTAPARGDADVVFAGEMGAVGLGETINVRLREAAPKQIPRLTVAPPVFKNLPPDGLEIRTPSGLFVLERG
jgi:hypothetical protein